MVTTVVLQLEDLFAWICLFSPSKNMQRFIGDPKLSVGVVMTVIVSVCSYVKDDHRPKRSVTS